MEELIKADAFFFITSVAIILITILLGVALIYLIQILRTTRDFMKKVKIEGEDIMADLKDLRERLKTEASLGKRVGYLFGFIRKFNFKSKNKNSKS